MAKKPDAVFTSLWGGHFVTFVKQAKPLKYFDAVKYNFLGRRRGGRDRDRQGDGRRLSGRHLGQRLRRLQLGQGPPPHKDYIARLRAYTKEEHPSSWPITGYIGMQILTAAITKAGSTDSDKVSKAMLGITVDTPIGKQTIRGKDHQANRAQFWGKMTKDPKLSVRGDEPADLHRSGAVHGLIAPHARWTAARPRPRPMRSRAWPRCSTSSSTLARRSGR